MLLGMNKTLKTLLICLIQFLFLFVFISHYQICILDLRIFKLLFFSSHFCGDIYRKSMGDLNTKSTNYRTHYI